MYDSRRLVNDVCVLTTAEPVGGTPTPIYSGALNSPSDCREPLLAGFGLTSQGGSAGRLYETEPNIVRVSPDEIEYDQRVEGGTCNGDSGGPLFCGSQLAGTTSNGDANCVENGVNMNLTKPSIRSWLAGFMGPVPEPPAADLDPAPVQGFCGDGICGQGESCNARWFPETQSCRRDCPSKRRPTWSAYCYVEGECVGPGCP